MIVPKPAIRTYAITNPTKIHIFQEAVNVKRLEHNMKAEEWRN